MIISAIQTDVAIGDPDVNLRVLERHVATEAAQGSRLIVFPECFVLFGAAHISLKFQI